MIFNVQYHFTKTSWGIFSGVTINQNNQRMVDYFNHHKIEKSNTNDYGKKRFGTGTFFNSSFHCNLAYIKKQGKLSFLVTDTHLKATSSLSLVAVHFPS